MSYRLGVDVGGTFTDLLLMEEESGRVVRAKVLSTPKDPSRAVLAGIDKICATAGIKAAEIGNLLHGTTIATNAILEGKGARVGLITTEGFRFTLQIARSHIPGGLGGWITHPKPAPLAPLELTIEARERIDKDGKVLTPLDDKRLRASLATLREGGVEAVTIAFMNAYVDGTHERMARDIVLDEMPGMSVSISSDVMPEMQEYERTLTTVVNSYVRPIVAGYISNLDRDLGQRGMSSRIQVLKSDGGLASVDSAVKLPVNLLVSGPAGGVSGALWVARQAGFANILTLDMGGTSTDVALIENGVPRVRRETTVADVTVRASSLDVRTVGAGGGSIAHVPELTKALRVGPESAGAAPGPAVYGKGGTRPTVTDADAVLGYLPDVRLAGDLSLDYAAARRAVQTIADALGVSVTKAASGIVEIVNERMFGALRLVSVQQGYDPRNFALMAFGGAGPLHANALGRLMQSWPVIIPPSPGVLCAFGDATTSLRNEASRTLIQKFSEVSDAWVIERLSELAESAAQALDGESVPRSAQTTSFEIDCRYAGQALVLPVPVDMAAFRREGLAALSRTFDAEHRKLFTFALDEGCEMVNLRAIAEAPSAHVDALEIPTAKNSDPAAAQIGQCRIFADDVEAVARVYDRPRLEAGHRVVGPAIVVEMDATTLILPNHVGEVDRTGCILIRPVEPGSTRS